MSTLAPVVCALDLAPESEPALVAAAALAARTEAPLHLVTVRAPAGRGAYVAPSDPEAAVRAVVEVTVDRALGAGACAELAPEIAVARERDPAAAVVEYAERVGAGTLVLGTHGRQGLQRFRLGSVAESVVRAAPCPVLVVPNRGPGLEPGPARPVLVAVDFSEPSARALRAARALADLHGAPLEALFVEDALAHASVTVAGSLGPASVPVSAVDVQTFAAAHGVAGLEAHVEAGDPAERIAARAEGEGAGAVVLGTHGRRGLSHALFGSVAEAALRRLPCPVLVVH